MKVIVRNCNNIRSGCVTIETGLLNIKYGINGTGKSTIAKAIELAARNGPEGLVPLTPYNSVGVDDDSRLPSVTGLPEDVHVAVFNEDYVNQYVFVENELVRNSFDIFIKTPQYEEKNDRIRELLASVTDRFNGESVLCEIERDLSEFDTVFGKNSKTGIAANGVLAKGLSKGNVIMNIPSELEEYTEFLRDNSNVLWLKWQADGKNYLKISDLCPFCARDITSRKSKIDRIWKEYDSVTVKHLSNLLSLFTKLEKYFSEETIAMVREIATCVEGITQGQKNYLLGIKNEVDIVLERLREIKNMSFWSLKGLDEVEQVLRNNRIDIRCFVHLKSEYTIQAISEINGEIDELLSKVGKLKGAIREQENAIRKTIERYSSEINAFLTNAGYQYNVSTMSQLWKRMTRHINLSLRRKRGNQL